MKTKRIVQISVVLSEEEHAALKLVAARMERSQADTIRKLVAKAAKDLDTETQS